MGRDLVGIPWRGPDPPDLYGPALKVTCPRCRVAPHQPCRMVVNGDDDQVVTFDGPPKRFPHRARVENCHTRARHAR